MIDRKPIIPPTRSPIPAAAARSGGQGRPPGRRGSRAWPLTAASTVAGIARVGTAVAVVSMVALMIGCRPAQAVAGEQPSDRRGETMNSAAESIAEASSRFHLPASWLRAVIQAESGGVATAVSPKGAIGLMQVMAGTYAQLRARFGLGRDPFQPRDNILAGAAYLREMLDRFGPEGFLAAYNAGPARVADHLATGRPLSLGLRHGLAAPWHQPLGGHGGRCRTGANMVADPINAVGIAAIATCTAPRMYPATIYPLGIRSPHRRRSCIAACRNSAAAR
jgi:hypothetical protein